MVEERGKIQGKKSFIEEVRVSSLSKNRVKQSYPRLAWEILHRSTTWPEISRENINQLLSGQKTPTEIEQRTYYIVLLVTNCAKSTSNCSNL